MTFRLILAITLFLSLLTGAAFAESPAPDAKQPLYVRRVDNLPADFIMGMDVSSVIAEEESGVKYYDFDGNEADVFQVLADSGINYIRVRVWNDPYDAEGRGFGGGNCDIDKAVRIGKRATACGMKLLVDFHYSDFWADPSKQMVPRAWAGMEIEEKTQAAYEYTRDCLLLLKDAGVDVGMVQMGNETNNKLCGEKTWFNIQYIMQAGAKATREVYPDALVALHFANPEQGNYMTYAKKMDYYQVDYDVFASSYYPYWHGTLDNLAATLSEVAQTYGKKVMVMETAYAYTAEDTDFFGNTVGDGAALTKNYPYTVQGQANSVADVIDTVAGRTLNGIGVCYWEGAWISVGGASYAENSTLWEQYGSGWATKYAAVYDPDDAGKYWGGCAVDNQAMFDASGHPLESLRVFSLVRTGSDAAIVPDAIEDALVICDLNGVIALPETVNAVMNDGSKQAVPVRWDYTEADEARLRAGGATKYTFTGDAGGMQARCTVSMIEANFLVNDSFEEGDLGWVVTDLADSEELYVENKPVDSLTGNCHLHFWSPGKNRTAFTAEQTVTDLPAGTYKYAISIMGGDAGETDIYAYVKVNGQIVATAPMVITSYNNWDTSMIPSFSCAAGDEVTVGIYVRCEGTGNGAWGKIDDAMLNSVR